MVPLWQARLGDPTASLDNKHSLGVTLLQITQSFQDPGTTAHLRPCSTADHKYLLCSTRMYGPTGENKPAKPKIHSRKERWLQMTYQPKGLSSLLLIPDPTFKNWHITLCFQQHAATCPTSSEASFWHYKCFAAMCFWLRTFNSLLFLRSERIQLRCSGTTSSESTMCWWCCSQAVHSHTYGFWLTM